MDFTLRYGLGLYPQEGVRKSFYGSASSPFVLQREKRKYSLSEKVEGIIIFFRYLQKQVVKF